MKKKLKLENKESKTGNVSRRTFLRTSGQSGAALAALAAIGEIPGVAQEKPKSSIGSTSTASARKEAALKIRKDAAQAYFDEKVASIITNGDEERYPDRRGNFSKTLPHNDLGEVDPKAYADFVAILMSGDPARFEQLSRDPMSQSKLSDPLAGYAFEIVGLDPQAVSLPAPPAFASAEHAFEMAELFWQMLSLDVPFHDYESNPLIQSAVADLNACSVKTAPKIGGKITPQSIFRGDTPGDIVGPPISQFLWMDIQYGIKPMDQRYKLPRSGQVFLTKTDEWLACQKGVRPTNKIAFDDKPRYISTNRDLSEWVHQDFNFQASLNAAFIIQKWGDEAISPMNPYRNSKTQSGGVTFGREVLGFLAGVTSASQKACYFHKWMIHRRARPEAFGGRLDNHLSGKKSYDIHADLLHCDGVARSFSAHGSRLLPVPYPEGSPTHPSYPAGHATNVGSGATILKAFFNEDMVVPKPLQANADGSALEPYTGPPLTLGNEINKLAHNISLGRDSGGVHYRSDGIQGMRVGEAVAISVLRDYSRTYREHFDGFTLTKFDGQKIRIVNGTII